VTLLELLKLSTTDKSWDLSVSLFAGVAHVKLKDQLFRSSICATDIEKAKANAWLIHV
jgi:hypothetical protein